MGNKIWESEMKDREGKRKEREGERKKWEGIIWICQKENEEKVQEIKKFKWEICQTSQIFLIFYGWDIIYMGVILFEVWKKCWNAIFIPIEAL